MHVLAMAHVWSSEGNLQVLSVFYHHVGSSDLTMVIRPGWVFMYHVHAGSCRGHKCHCPVIEIMGLYTT